MSDEQQMNMIETLSEELGEKELKIMALEKELEKTKLILGEADELIHNVYIEDRIQHMLGCEYGDCQGLKLNEEYEEDLSMNQYLFNHIMPESLEILERDNYGFQRFEFKLTIKNDTDTIIVIKRVK
tara:strand:+ start:121 stop:501 length:381 start_codon:yes stop_codon:yes gene_type:complete